MSSVRSVLAWAGDDGRRAAEWCRALLLEADLGLEERVKDGWKALTYHHREAGYVVGVFPRPGEAQVVIEHGHALEGFDELFDRRGRQVRTIVVTSTPDRRAAQIVDVVTAAIAMKAAP